MGNITCEYQYTAKQYQSMHFSYLNSVYFRFINQTNINRSWLGFINGCGRNNLACPVLTKKQSSKGGMIISWKNKLYNTIHHGISINHYLNDNNEYCNTLGYQYVLFDKEYDYIDDETLLVIPNESNPLYGSIIKE